MFLFMYYGQLSAMKNLLLLHYILQKKIKYLHTSKLVMKLYTISLQKTLSNKMMKF